MDGYIQTGLGIIVSLLLFIIGYRQTIGASKERINIANKMVEQILLKRIVLEDYELKTTDLSILLESISREQRVKVSSLYSEPQILNTLFMKIFDNDFIPVERRNLYLSKVNLLIDGYYQEIEEIKLTSNLPKENRESFAIRISSFPLVTISMALLSSAVGGAVSIYPQLDKMDFKLLNSDVLMPAIAVSGISVLIIIFIFIIYRFREPTQEKQYYDNPALAGFKFETDVINYVKNNRPQLKVNTRENDIDIIIEYNGKVILVDTKYWILNPIKQALLKRIGDLGQTFIKYGAEQTIIVTNKVPEERFQDNNINLSIMTFDEFKKFVKQLK